MEGGKKMKSRIIFKSIFVFFLTIILFCLIFIIFDKTGTGATIYNPPAIVDYTIIDNRDECENNTELIYSDKNYNYYLVCSNSSSVFLSWDEGVVDPLKFALEKEKVTMNSLINHGLKVIKNEK